MIVIFKKNFPVRVEGLSVEVKGSFERSLKIFSKKVQDSGLLRELKERERYEKPSAKRKRRKQIAISQEHKRRLADSLSKNRYN